MKNRWGYVLAALLLPAVVVPTIAMADELEEVRSLRDTTIALVNALVKQGVLTREKADELIAQAEQAGKKGSASPGVAMPGGAAAAPVEPGVVRVPYVPEAVKEEIRDEVKQEVVAEAKQDHWGVPGVLPEWLDRISFSGDVRFRAQQDRFPTDNAPNATPQQLQLPEFGAYNINNTDEQRDRLRLRVRFGAEARIGDSVTTAIRLTTGSAGTGGDPSTENENLGNYNTRGTVGFDRAYITYSPTSWFYFTGGRLGNPFFSPTTLVWGDDLSLQGAILGFTPQFTPGFKAYAQAGAFPIQDVEPTPLTSSRSKWMYGYQGGFNWQITPIAAFNFGSALYSYRHLQGMPNGLDSTVNSLSAAPFRQKGNTVFDINGLQNTVDGTQNYLIGLASKFDELNVSGSLNFTLWDAKHLVLDLDWVRNLGFNQNEILQRAGLALTPGSYGTTGMQEKLTFGDISFVRKYSWQAYVGFRHVESDAVVDAFTDSDFHLGGTNATGYYLGGRFAFETNTTIGVRWFSAKQITGLPLAIDVLQLDLMAAF